MARKTKLFVNFLVTDEGTQAQVWTTKARRSYQLERPHDIVELVKQFTDVYSIYVQQHKLERDDMITMSEALRGLGHTIAF